MIYEKEIKCLSSGLIVGIENELYYIAHDVIMHGFKIKKEDFPIKITIKIEEDKGS